MIFRDLKLGLNTYVEAFGFIFRKGLWYYFLFPILFSILVLGGLFVAKAEIIEWINDWLMVLTGFDHTQNDVQGWFGKIIRFFVGISIWILTTYIIWTMNKYLVLIALSPVLALLSEKTESILTGKKIPFSVTQFLSDILRGSMIAVRNLFIEMLLLLVLTIVGLFLPVLAPLIIVLLFVISAYFYGYSMMDYTNERHRLTVGEGNTLILNNRVLAISNGALFDLLMRIQVLGVTVAPILGCVGATLALHRKYDLNKNLKTLNS